MAFLEVNDIFKSFGDFSVLKGVSFSIERGEVLSIIGSSGNGKTTLLRCVNLLEIASSGNIVLDGELFFDAKIKYKDREMSKMQQNIGMVFQSFNLFPQYTALQNVTLALDVKAENELKLQKVGYFARKKAMKEIKRQNIEYAKGILDKVGLLEKINYYPCQLSGGQQQRVAIARALSLKPKILCFDEPTSALDPELTGEVLNVIKELKSPEIAMIIVTHEMKFAKEVSDKIIFMVDGKIEDMGSPTHIFELSQNPKTKAFLGSFTD